MTVATIACEQCGTRVPSAEATYSTSGLQICRSCHAGAELAAGDARVAENQRTTRIIFAVTALLVVGIPGGLIAAGQTQLLSTALCILGGVLLFGGNTARRMFVARNANPDPAVARGTIFMMLGGAGLFGLGMLLQSLVRSGR
jgi:hypothetical protein